MLFSPDPLQCRFLAPIISLLVPSLHPSHFIYKFSDMTPWSARILAPGCQPSPLFCIPSFILGDFRSSQVPDVFTLKSSSLRWPLSLLLLRFKTHNSELLHISLPAATIPHPFFHSLLNYSLVFPWPLAYLFFPTFPLSSLASLSPNPVTTYFTSTSADAPESLTLLSFCLPDFPGPHSRDPRFPGSTASLVC